MVTKWFCLELSPGWCYPTFQEPSPGVKAQTKTRPPLGVLLSGKGYWGKSPQKILKFRVSKTPFHALSDGKCNHKGVTGKLHVYGFFFLPLWLYVFFFYFFFSAWISFLFFPHPPPPLHFSNGPSLMQTQKLYSPHA